MTRVIDVAAQLLSDYPELANAPQPRRSSLPLQSVDNAPLVAPNPPREGRWLGPLPVEGDCLLPYFPAGRSWFWIDPTQAPQDRDLVLVFAGPETMNALLEAGAECPEWQQKYPTIPNVWIKQARIFGGFTALVQRAGGMTFGSDMRIFGVVARDK